MNARGNTLPPFLQHYKKIARVIKGGNTKVRLPPEGKTVHSVIEELPYLPSPHTKSKVMVSTAFSNLIPKSDVFTSAYYTESENHVHR